MEMINRVPPKAVDTKIVACRGGMFLSKVSLLYQNTADLSFLSLLCFLLLSHALRFHLTAGQFQLGHPVEFLKVYGTTEAEPAVCKYCGLRYYHCAGAH